MPGFRVHEGATLPGEESLGHRVPEGEPTGRGYFVCLEGIDGAGKTTAVTAAGEMLRGRGWPVVSFDKKDTDFTRGGHASAYVERHMSALREVIWGHPPDDPYLELGDFHWVYLQAAWYAALAHCKVVPLLRAGQVVLTDTWAYKFLAKLTLRPGVDVEHARSAFSRLPRPDLVIRLHLDPEVAAARKQTFAISEAGNHEGAVERSAQEFIAYQQRLSAVLEEFAQAEGWVSLEVGHLGVEQMACAVADLVEHHLKAPCAGHPGPLQATGVLGS